MPLDFCAVVGVGDHHAVLAGLDDLRFGDDILILFQRLFHAAERTVRFQPQSVRVVYQGVARDAGGVVIFFTKAAVDDQQLAAGADRQLALDGANGRMAVDDVRRVGIEPEFLEDLIAGEFLVIVAVVGILFLVPRGLVVGEGALEGLELSAAQGRERRAPQVPHEIQSQEVLFLAEEYQPCDLVGGVEVLSAAELFAEQVHGLKTAAVVHRHTSVIQQVAVAAAVHPAVFKQEGDVTLQAGAVEEGAAQLRDDLLLAVRQAVGVALVEGGEEGIVELVPFSFTEEGAVVHIDRVQDQAVVHIVIGVPQDDLSLQLELDDGDRLERRVHGGEVGIKLLGEERQLSQADAVAVLEGRHRAVFDAVAHNVRDARVRAARRAHPQDIVIAPFNIHAGVLHQQFDDPVRRIAAVEDIAHDVQAVYREALDQLGERDHEVLRVDAQDGLEDLVMIAHLVVVLIRLGVHQLVDDVGEVLGHRLAHFGARVFGREVARELQHLFERGAVPFVVDRILLVEEAELFFRIVDQRAQLALLLIAEPAAEDPFRFFADDAGAVVEDVTEGFVFAVDVAHKVLGALGQVQYRAEVDDLALEGA